MEIQDDNIFTRCPAWGREFAIDIVELLQDGKSDLYSTVVYCTQCSSEGVG